jgi:hypothetical protein|tara:strand:- start:389 stop:667 length:279 start_codon:yes stop_codon:yes gene_type:complete
MAANSIQKDSDLPAGCGYNKIFKHQWHTPEYGLPQSAVTDIKTIVKDKWGWHFIPHKDMDYHSDRWFEKQHLVLSFNNQTDLILCKLIIHLS